LCAFAYHEQKEYLQVQVTPPLLSTSLSLLPLPQLCQFLLPPQNNCTETEAFRKSDVVTVNQNTNHKSFKNRIRSEEKMRRNMEKLEAVLYEFRHSVP
jgi:hypothetical protein